jgi:hypothetical protein
MQSRNFLFSYNSENISPVSVEIYPDSDNSNSDVGSILL